jgi:hypothetical protein
MHNKLKSKPHWEYLPYNRKMGNTSDTLLKVLQRGGFTSEELLAREGLQNCKDAHSEDAVKAGLPVQVTIEKHSISGDHAKNLFKALLLDEDQQLKLATSLIHPMTTKEFKSYVSGEQKLDLVTVRDQNTVGLGGSLEGDEEKDHFARLVLGLGQSDKVEGGGSFGFGKTVFSKLSKIHLVLYYSHFKPTRRTGGCSARFMAVWLLRKDIAKKFSGFGFFGKRNGSNDESLPFEDEEAHAMAEMCGLKPHKEGEFGTTVAVVDCPIVCEHVKFAIERYWWPSLVDKKLSVRLFEKKHHENKRDSKVEGDKLEVDLLDNGSRLSISPSSNPMVLPYLEIYQAMRDSSGKHEGIKIDPPFNKMHGKKIGQVATRKLDKATIDSIRDYLSGLGLSKEENPMPLGGIAKMRTPGMVINYEGETAEDLETIPAGVFIADDEIDLLLRGSEPATHNKWDSAETDRIHDAAKHLGLDEDHAVDIVMSVNKRISNKIIDARKEPPPPSKDARLGLLEKFLSDLLNVGGKPARPDTEPRPFSIDTVSSKKITADGKRLDTATITLALKRDYSGPPLQFRVEVEGKVLEGPGTSSGHPVTTTLNFNGKTVSGRLPSVVCKLDKKYPATITAQAVCSKKEVIRFGLKFVNAAKR